MELLIVLSLTTFLLIVSSSWVIRTYDSFQYHQFIQQFDQDLFYLQQLSLSQKDHFYLQFERKRHRYHIRQGGFGSRLLTRHYPEHWTIEPNTLKLPIQFSSKGNIKKPGTLKIRTRTQVYTITCPFGKGRCYDEQK